MDEPTRARVVGASVFALFGVLVLPWLFSDPVDPRRGIQSRFAADAPPVTQLPNRPAGRRPNQTPPESVAIATVAPRPTVSQKPRPAPAAPSPRPRPKTRPAPTKKPVVRATPAPRWQLQLASYGQQENAQRFAAELKKIGHEPRVLRAKSQGRTVWRVQLHLGGSESQAKKVQQGLNTKFGIRSVLRQL